MKSLNSMPDIYIYIYEGKNRLLSRSKEKLPINIEVGEPHSPDPGKLHLIGWDTAYIRDFQIYSLLLINELN